MSAGLYSDRQDFAAFVTRAHATKGILNRVLAMLSAIQPQPLLPISITQSTSHEGELRFAPDALLSTAPVQIVQPVQPAAQQVLREVDNHVASALQPVHLQTFIACDGSRHCYWAVLQHQCCVCWRGNLTEYMCMCRVHLRARPHFCFHNQLGNHFCKIQSCLQRCL